MTVLFSRKVGRPLLAGFVVLLTLGGAGCGSGRGDLSGKVSYQGNSLAVGSVVLLSADGNARTTWIQADGSYHFADVPVGGAKLAVFSPDPVKRDELRKKAGSRGLSSKMQLPPEPAEPALPVVDRTKWFAIPAEYSDVDHSGLHVTIHRGPNTYPLDMK